MKYLLIKYGEEKFWYELDDEGYAIRQIILDEYSQIHVSCLEDCLAEGPIIEEDLEGSIEDLSKREFDILWQDALKKYEKLWEEVKKKYPIGVYVQGEYSYRYPQGSIIRGTDFIAVYKGDEPFYLNRLVQYKVKSFDDTNMRLMVG